MEWSVQRPLWHMVLPTWGVQGVKLEGGPVGLQKDSPVLRLADQPLAWSADVATVQSREFRPGKK